MKYKFDLIITGSSVHITTIDENGNQNVRNLQYSDETQQKMQKLDAAQLVVLLEKTIKELIDELPSRSEITEIKLRESLDAWLFMDADGTMLLNQYLNVTEVDKLQGYLKALKLNGVIDQLEAKSGVMISTETPLIFALWFKNEQRHLLSHLKYLSSMHEYIHFAWTGKNQITPHLAARTGMFDLEKNTWNPQALALVEMSEDILPEVVTDDQIVTNLLPEVIERLGVSKHTQVHW